MIKVLSTSVIFAILATLSLTHSAKELCMARDAVIAKLKQDFPNQAADETLMKRLAAATIRVNERSSRFYYWPASYRFDILGEDTTFSATLPPTSCEIDVPFDQCNLDFVQKGPQYIAVLSISGSDGDEGGSVNGFTLTKDSNPDSA